MTPLVLFLACAAFLFGLIAGSFLNVCIYRMPREESLVFPPSHCPRCYQQIRWEDNIPVLSWFLLKGRCRDCGGRISPMYPAVEFLTGAAFVLIFWRFVSMHMLPMPEFLTSRELLYFAVFYIAHAGFVSALFVATAVDFKCMIIPDVISIPGVAAGLFFSLVFPQLHPELTLAGYPHWGSLLASLVGAAVGAGLIYGIGAAGKAVLRKEAMGFGDVKLMAMIGAFLGWQLTVFVLFLSAALGTIYGGIHLAVTGKSKIPYGPFLSIAAVISLLLSREIYSFISSVLVSYRILLWR